MKASFVDLRKKSAQIIRALDRNERVIVLYRGQEKAIMQPIGRRKKGSLRSSDHPAFGLWADREDIGDVSAHVRKLRKGRFDGA